MLQAFLTTEYPFCSGTAQESEDLWHSAATIKSGMGIPSNGQSTALISYGHMGAPHG